MTKHGFLKYFLASLTIALCANFALADIEHTVAKGETLFGIANKYGVTVEQLVKWNPGTERGVKKGMKIIIRDGNSPEPEPEISVPAQSVEDKAEKEVVSNDEASNAVVEETAHNESADDNAKIYIVRKGDTFKSISKSTKVSEDRIIELNPFVDPANLTEGQSIRLTDDAPFFQSVAVSTNVEPVPNPTTKSEESQGIFEIGDLQDLGQLNTDIFAPQDSGEYKSNIMILLPFMANAETQTRQAQYYTDFYRGFLLAAKNHTNSDGHKVDVITLDSGNDIEHLRNQMKFNSHRDISVIIAPEDEKQLAAIIDYASENGIYTINAFNFKNEAFRTNPYVVQANIDQSLMYKKAIQGLIDNYPEHIPVILSTIEGKTEKKAFTNELAKAYQDKGIEPIEISYEESLTDEHLSSLDPFSSYVFIPKSGALGIFNSFAPAIINLQNEAGGSDHYMVFGYPDWTAYRGESLDLLHTLNAIIYSRFYFNEDDNATKNLNEEFFDWYGQSPIEAVPNQALLGFDLGNFLLGSLQEGPIEKAFDSHRTEKGVQSSFSFGKEDGEDAGYVNEALYLIRYNPDNTCTATVL